MADPMPVFQEMLRCALTDEEVATRADRCARVVKERDEAETTRKNVNKAMKKAIDDLDLEIRALAYEVRDRAAYREVNCLDRENHEAGTMETVRLDTGEVVRDRPLTAAERQLSILPPEEPVRRKRGMKDGDTVVGAP